MMSFFMSFRAEGLVLSAERMTLLILLVQQLRYLVGHGVIGRECMSWSIIADEKMALVSS